MTEATALLIFLRLIVHVPLVLATQLFGVPPMFQVPDTVEPGAAPATLTRAVQDDLWLVAVQVKAGPLVVAVTGTGWVVLSVSPPLSVTVSVTEYVPPTA